MNSNDVSVLSVTVALAGVAGLFVGSFLNVVIYRTPLGLSVATPRSFCPTCDRQLMWWENVPVVSWLGLRGRCRTCDEPISMRYPLVEVATGGTFALTTWAWHGTVFAAAYCVLAAAMIAVGLIEYGSQRAPASVAAIGAGLGEAIIIVGGSWQHGWTVVIGSLVGLVVSLTAYGALRGSDPAETDPRGHGRSALLLAGCWAGGLGPIAATVGAFSLMVGYLGCMAGLWTLSRQSVAAGSAPNRTGRTIHLAHPALETPLVTAILVAMVASLVVGA